ncbi:hypothetical protein HNR07_005703 [Nocardiopsis metallicus]|uniref:Uncharacterized protein n=1 Tax=Nocardiopsis metallicus TaxID=179819 RepID=A0A840WSG1_9ACTN|nr:hypothetical protein [Nocardiopsis metallicus]
MREEPDWSHRSGISTVAAMTKSAHGCFSDKVRSLAPGRI